MRVWLPSLLIIGALLGLADAAAAHSAAVWALGTAQVPAPTDTRLRTVVMGIAPRRGLKDPELGNLLSDVVLGAYAKDPQRVVIGPDDIRRALEWEASRQQAGCDDTKCLAEVGAALDAHRIVSGTLDLIGDGYLLSLSEIDARTLEPVARAQEEVKKDEGELVKLTRRLAEQLMSTAQAAKATTASALFSGSSGSIDLSTDPRGAQVLVGGQPVGTTPVRIDNVNPGRHTVRLTRDDYETVDVEVPVHPGGTTTVQVEMRILRAIAQQNLEMRQAKWREADEWNRITGWTKGIAGVVVIAGGGAFALGSLKNGLFDGDTVAAAAVIGIGGGVLAWGTVDLLSPPPQPVAEWELERKVTITPPKGSGDAEVRLIQEAAKPAAVR